jgi:hypothetical protein
MEEKLIKYLENRLAILDKLLNATSGEVTNDAFEDSRILGQIGEVKHMLAYINIIKNEK